jgi:predicted alpha/beta superfamily hydrolase
VTNREVGSSGPAAVRESDTYRLWSRHVDAEFEVRVARPLPPFMAQPASTHDVLYVLDGDLFFGLATDVTRLMYQLFGELPATLVVAVGYGAVDGRTFGETRNRDFTPTAPTSFPGLPAPPPGAPALPQNFGGADRFLAFLLEEVRPLIAERYPAATGPSTLFGSSMGGLFASHVLLERPESFERYVIASPALWWDDHLLVRTAPERPLLRGDAPARVFLGAGALEEGAGPFLDQFKMVSNLSDFARCLRGRAAEIDVSSHVFDGESHTSVVPAVLTRGLRALQRP